MVGKIGSPESGGARQPNSTTRHGAPSARKISVGIAGTDRVVKIAKMLGVDDRTIRRDTAANAAPVQKKTKKNHGDEVPAAANAAPARAAPNGATEKKTAARPRGIPA
jgi:hypothetical protein